MNRRELFRALIYAPLIAPLAGMMPKELPTWIVPSSASSGKVIEGVSSARKNTMPQETIEFRIDVNSKAGLRAVERMTKALKEMHIEGSMFNPDDLHDNIMNAWMEAAVKANSYRGGKLTSSTSISLL